MNISWMLLIASASEESWGVLVPQDTELDHQREDTAATSLSPVWPCMPDGTKETTCTQSPVGVEPRGSRQPAEERRHQTRWAKAVETDMSAT